MLKLEKTDLFMLIYINNLPKVSNELFSVLYADDTCISLSNTSYENLMNEFHIELNKIIFCLSKNRFSNIAKTIAINFFLNMFLLILLKF